MRDIFNFSFTPVAIRSIRRRRTRRSVRGRQVAEAPKGSGSPGGASGGGQVAEAPKGSGWPGSVGTVALAAGAAAVGGTTKADANNEPPLVDAGASLITFLLI